MDLFEGGIVKFDDIRYMAKRLYGMLPTYCEPKQIVLDFSYSSPNTFSDIVQLENPIFATSVMVSKKGKGSKVYVSASADNVENEKAFEVGTDGGILSCGSLWRFIQVTGDKSGGDDVQLIVTGYELGYAFEPIPIENNYIEGYAVQVDGVYPATIQARINNTITTINIDQSTGYWKWVGVITYLGGFMDGNDTCSYIKVNYEETTPLYMYNAFRRSESITHLDCSGVEASNLYYAFGINAPDYNNGYRSALQSIKLPIIRNTTANSNSCCGQTRQLTDVEASYIESSISFSNSPLTLQSAINILNALQDVTSYGGATLTFSSSTSALVQADTEAMNLVAQAQNLGWTIAFN